MHLRNSERLQERVHIDLEAGMIMKIIVACLGVGGAIFYLGLTLGQGEAIAHIRGVSEADGLKQLEGSLRVLAPERDAATDGSLLLFPTLLSRRADQRVQRDELTHTLAHFRTQNPETGEVVEVDPNSMAKDGTPIPGGALGSAPQRSAEAGELPDPDDVPVEIVVAPAPEPADEEEAVEEPERQTVGKYTLQLQSFRDPDEARVFRELMEERGYHPFVQKVQLGDKGVWHRVRIGRFMKMKSAQKFKSQFEREQGFSTRIMSL